MVTPSILVRLERIRMGMSNESSECQGPELTSELLWLLSDECNRFVIRYLLESERSEVTLDEIGEFVAKYHSDDYLQDLDNTLSRLHHQSLPQLHEHEIILYDSSGRVVESHVEHALPCEVWDLIESLDEAYDLE